MTIELRPLGVNCNLLCQYCYQNPQRDAGNLTTSYDWEAMREALDQAGGPFSLFGGEPLLLPEEELEKFWAYGLERHGQNGIQTNGALITANHIRLFKEYKVGVGISIDGPGELNDARWAGSLERTREATARTESAILELCREGVAPSLIITLHRNNATPDKRPLLKDWLRYLDSYGVRSVRLHLLEVEDPAIREKYALSSEENIEAFMDLARFEQTLPNMRFDIFHDMTNLLLGLDEQATCVWNACDPYTTRAVQGIEGRGQRSNCGRTNKDGVDFVKADQAGHERQLALYHTPQEHGGCSGCRFFLMCKGNCPGTALDGDWRNRTEHCEVYLALYERLERRLLEEGMVPLSVHPVRRYLEHALLEAWRGGQSVSMASVLSRLNRARLERESSIAAAAE